MSAKELELRPIASRTANALVKQLHYSGKVCRNSQLHLGVFWRGRLEGALQFGPSLAKWNLIHLVEGTQWHEFTELNRLAFSDALPRNSESRALAVAMRLLRKHAPQLKWVVSFADATQAGDGAIYRASGFVLTGIKRNADLWRMPGGEILFGGVAFNASAGGQGPSSLKARYGKQGSGNGTVFLQGLGAERLPGFQLRYLYFLDPGCRERLTVPELPFSAIAERGAGMYRGKPRAGSIAADAPAVQAGEGGSTPTPALHSAGAA